MANLSYFQNCQFMAIFVDYRGPITIKEKKENYDHDNVV